MRRWWPAAVVVAVSACPSPPPAAPPQVDAGAVLDAGTVDAPTGDRDEDDRAWSTASADGAAVLRQKGSADLCYVSCTLGDGGMAWDARIPCMGERHALRFVAADCGKTVVLIPAPDRGRPWAQTEVMRVYEREKLKYAVMGVTVVPEARMRTSPTWLKGTYDVPGERPAYTADGTAVAFESLAGPATVVSLLPEASAPLKDRPPPKKKKSKRR